MYFFLAANQETVVELVGFVRQLFPNHPSQAPPKATPQSSSTGTSSNESSLSSQGNLTNSTPNLLLDHDLRSSLHGSIATLYAPPGNFQKLYPEFYF